MSFNEGDQVVWLNSGQEIPATVIAHVTDGKRINMYSLEVHGERRNVPANEVLEPKKPGYEVRDLALVIDEGRSAVQGEIVAIGRGPKDRLFYQLRFEGIHVPMSWYSEDEIFVVSVESEVASGGVFFVG